MPQIPVAGPVEPGRYPTMSPAAAGAPWDIVIQSAETAGQLGEQVGELGKKIQSVEDHVLTSRGQNDLNADIDKMEAAFRQRTDWNNFNDPKQPDNIEQVQRDIRDKYQKDYAKNPRVARAMAPYVESRLQDLAKTVELRRVSLLRDEGEAQLARSLDKYQIDIASTDIDAEKAKVKNDANAEIRLAETQGIITRSQGQTMSDNFGLRSEEREIIEAIRSDDINRVNGVIGRMADKNNYPELSGKDPQRLAVLEGEAKSKMDSLMTKQNKAQDSFIVDRALDDLRTHSDSFEAKIKTLSDKNWLNRKGLTDEAGYPNSELVKKVRDQINAEESDNKKVQEEQETKARNDIMKDFLAGNKNQVVLDKIKNYHPEASESMLSWFKTIQDGVNARARKADSEISKEEETPEYLRIIQMMDEGKDPNEISAAIVSSKNLTTAWQKSLIDRVESMKAHEQQQGITAADKFLRGQIAPSQGLLGAASSLEMGRLAMALQDLDNYVTKENQGRVGHKAPMTSAEILKYARDNVRQYMTPLDERMHFQIDQASIKPKPTGPKKGDVIDGWIFQGGDPSDRKNWVKK